MTMIADTSRIRATLDWTPQYDDLETIAGACAGLGTEAVPRAPWRAAARPHRPKFAVRRKSRFGLKNHDIAGKETFRLSP